MPAVLTFNAPITQPDIAAAAFEPLITVVNGAVTITLNYRDSNGDPIGKSEIKSFTLTEMQRQAQAQSLIAIAVSQGVIPPASVSFEPDVLAPTPAPQEP
jgi:hypothetical protein